MLFSPRKHAECFIKDSIAIITKAVTGDLIVTIEHGENPQHTRNLALKWAKQTNTTLHFTHPLTQ